MRIIQTNKIIPAAFQNWQSPRGQRRKRQRQLHLVAFYSIAIFLYYSALRFRHRRETIRAVETGDVEGSLARPLGRHRLDQHGSILRRRAAQTTFRTRFRSRENPHRGTKRTRPTRCKQVQSL